MQPGGFLFIDGCRVFIDAGNRGSRVGSSFYRRLFVYSDGKQGFRTRQCFDDGEFFAFCCVGFGTTNERERWTAERGTLPGNLLWKSADPCRATSRRVYDQKNVAASIR